MLLEYLQYPFVKYAFIVSIFISLISALIGTTLLLKRMSFIGSSLSHVAFSIISVASVLNLTNKMYITLPLTIVCTIILLNKTQTYNDSSLAILSVSSLATGYIIINLFSKNANISGDVCTTLFGSTSILTLSITDVYLCIILSVITIIIFIVFYNQIFTTTFDTTFARTTGLNVKVINLVFSILIATVIVLAMNLVGSLLITALIIFPSLSAMCLFHNFKSVTICAVILSIICTFAGLSFSIIFSTPVGSSIVICNLIIYLLFILLSKVKGYM